MDEERWNSVDLDNIASALGDPLGGSELAWNFDLDALQPAGSFLGADMDALAAEPCAAVFTTQQQQPTHTAVVAAQRTLPPLSLPPLSLPPLSAAALCSMPPVAAVVAKVEPQQQCVSSGPVATSVEQQQQDDDDELDSSHEGGTAGGKRRRRQRNLKQQELNRLAQQRYRQRKKDKYSELQVTVGSLQSQLDRLSVLEGEAAQFKAAQAQLQAQVASRDAALAQAAAQLRAATAQAKAAQDKCAAQERVAAEQQAVIDQQRQQLRTTTVAGLDPQALSDRLLSIIKAALAEAGAQQQQLLASEAVVQQISRTLTSSCRDLIYQQRLLAPSEAAPKAIPVSCF